jgi:hypothetical protein
LDAYQVAIELPPQLVTLGLDLQSRQQAWTSSSDGLAHNGAACAIRPGQYDKAVGLLEDGRTVFWLQAMKLRTLMTPYLGNVTSNLKEKLTQISSALDQA